MTSPDPHERFEPLTTKRQAIQWIAVTTAGGVLATTALGPMVRNPDRPSPIQPGQAVSLRLAYQGASPSGDLVNISVLPDAAAEKDPGGPESPIFAGIGMQYDRTDPSRSLLVAYVSDSDPATSLVSAEVTIGEKTFPMTEVEDVTGEVFRFEIGCEEVVRSITLPISIEAERSDESRITAFGIVDSRVVRTGQRTCLPYASLA